MEVLDHHFLRTLWGGVGLKLVGGSLAWDRGVEAGSVKEFRLSGLDRVGRKSVQGCWHRMSFIRVLKGGLTAASVLALAFHFAGPLRTGVSEF